MRPVMPQPPKMPTMPTFNSPTPPLRAPTFQPSPSSQYSAQQPLSTNIDPRYTAARPAMPIFQQQIQNSPAQSLQLNAPSFQPMTPDPYANSQPSLLVSSQQFQNSQSFSPQNSHSNGPSYGSGYLSQEKPLPSYVNGASDYQSGPTFPGQYQPSPGVPLAYNAFPNLSTYGNQSPNVNQTQFTNSNGNLPTGQGFPPSMPPSLPGGPSQHLRPSPISAPSPAGNMGNFGHFPAIQPGFPQSSGGMGYVNGATSPEMPHQNRYGQSSGQSNLQNSYHADGARIVNLLQSRKILPPDGVEVPSPEVKHTVNSVNCSPDIFRCTLTVIPNTPALLQKSRLPLAILVHPYKDLSNLQVLSCNTIVRCRSCRSYINPFVTFIDQYKWRCNMCDRSNDLPQEFFHDPITNTVGDPTRRPEVRTATIEYIAPGEYALRPPQPAIYIFLLDVCFNAIEVRYLDAFRERLLACLERLPGDARTQVAFVAYDSAIHFFQLDNSDWKMLTVADIDDIFVPSLDGIVNLLHENMGPIRDLVGRLPEIFRGQRDTHSSMGAAVQIAHKILAPTGGRITIMQTCLPTLGPGALKAREDPNLRAAKDVKFLDPATDFYKTLALECSSNQVAVDLFLLAGQYADLTTISGIARYSGGCIHYYPAFNSVSNAVQLSRYESDFTRYLTRKIGFESVMRVRCTNGMSLTAFHGNFFVRSVDLLSLPNINPDSGFAVQIKMDDALVSHGSVCFQAALLYTSSKGERRIRVHTLSVPVSDNLQQIFAGADQEAIASIVGKMAAERAFTQSLGDVRDGIVFACEDALRAYTVLARPSTGQLLAPYSLRLLPLFTHSLLNCVGLRSGVSTTLDQRTASLLQLKAAPLAEEMMTIYPRLYAVHNIKFAPENEDHVPKLEQLHLSYENVERGGVYLLEGPVHIILYITQAVSPDFCDDVLGVANYDRIPDRGADLPDLETDASIKLRAFLAERYAHRPLHPVLEITKETGKDKLTFLQYLFDDRSDSMTQSYYEFLTDLSRKVKNG